MKTFVTCICIIFSLNANAQFVSIPDTNFRNWLNTNGFANCMNGNLIDTTCFEVLNADTINIFQGSGINNLDGIQYFDNLLCLTLNNSQSTPANKRLNNIPAFPNSLKYISFSWHSLSTLPPLPATLEYLYCYYGTLQTLPALPNGIKTLWCNNNNLSVLPSLPDSLREFICWSNNFSTFPTLPDSLKNFRCGNNPITTWPSLPDSLEEIWIESGQTPAIALPVLSDSLDIFICSGNDWTSLPTLPPALKFLRCQSNLLTTLPLLPSSLETLQCGYNLINVLPTLPDSLLNLSIDRNPITTFPPLPPGLISLTCDSINLVNFPAAFPSTLRELSCNNNPLISIPPLSSTFRTLKCENTFITQLPAVGVDMFQLYISNCPFLTCFPFYQDIDYLRWTNTPITCLPNAGYIGNATPAITGLPLCVSSSSCLFNWKMYGKIYNDTNFNCTIDSAENTFRNLRVNLKSGGTIVQSMIFNTEGYYSFNTGFGSYEVEMDTAGIPFNVNCPSGGIYLSNITAVDSTDEDLDFGLNCKPGFMDLEARSISPEAFLVPGNDVVLRMKAGDASLFYGVSCASGVSGTVQATLNGPVTYVSQGPNALIPSSVTFNTITWNISDFSQVNPLTDFDIIIHVDTTATVFDTLCVTLAISPLNDSYSLNNILTHCFPIHSSFDPNAKEVYPFGNIDTSVQWLTYTVFFQNTGNFPAHYIQILDTIDTDLDLNSFQFLASSHDPIIQILASNVVKFSFPNIYLPDSTHDEPNSHGYVQYRIRTWPGLPIGTTIDNTAAIYFDYNAPVITNTVQNVVSNSVSLQEIAESKLLIYPNPATNIFTILAPAAEYAHAIITLTDCTGKVILKESFDETSEIIIDSSLLPNGVYQVKVEGKDFVSVEKVVILK